MVRTISATSAAIPTLRGGDKVALLLLVAALLRAVAQGGLGDAQAVKEHDVVADVVHIGQQPVVGLGKKARQKKHRDKARDLGERRARDDVEKAAPPQRADPFPQPVPVGQQLTFIHRFSFPCALPLCRTLANVAGWLCRRRLFPLARGALAGEDQQIRHQQVEHLNERLVVAGVDGDLHIV